MDTPEQLRKQLFGRKVVFHLSATDPSLAQNVAKLPFIHDIKAVDNKLVITMDDPETHNPEIVRLLVGLGINIIFIGELRHSLEDVYLQLVRGA